MAQYSILSTFDYVKNINFPLICRVVFQTFGGSSSSGGGSGWCFCRFWLSGCLRPGLALFLGWLWRFSRTSARTGQFPFPLFVAIVVFWTLSGDFLLWYVVFASRLLLLLLPGQAVSKEHLCHFVETCYLRIECVRFHRRSSWSRRSRRRRGRRRSGTAPTLSSLLRLANSAGRWGR